MKIFNSKVYGLEESIIASGYPLQSNNLVCFDVEDYSSIVNAKDMKRAVKLAACKIGTGHDNFLNGIIVQCDIVAPTAWWRHFDRYHFKDYVSSQSTMHCLTEFDLKQQYHEFVDPIIKNRMIELVEDYKKDPTNKEKWYTLIFSNPAGFLIGARITLNYRQLKTIKLQRKHHKLEYEWGPFIQWINELPYAHELIGEG